VKLRFSDASAVVIVRTKIPVWPLFLA